MNEELDFDFVPSKNIAHGRRAGAQNLDVEEDGSALNRQPPTKKVGGWGQDGSGVDIVHGRTEMQTANSIGILTLTETRDSDDELNIPVIPDLTESEGRRSSGPIAEPPSVILNCGTSYQDLDEQLLCQSSLRMLVSMHPIFVKIPFIFKDSGLDLKMLTKQLRPEYEVQENIAHGRRAGAQNLDVEEDGSALNRQPPTKKVGGWGQDGSGVDIVHGRTEMQTANSIGILTLTETRDSDDELNIPVIPDLTESEGRRSSGPIAEPPRLVVVNSLN
ncbi:hypothetical protein AHF37_04467 [Paragonimus kellicotti]|nr:hypothetical protein AHF37_04467 [Paragonimus kellicotti]